MLAYKIRWWHTGTCFIQKMYAPSSSLLQGKHLPFNPSPLRLNIFRLFVILSLTQLHRYTPEIFLFSTATFKYKYRAPLRRIWHWYSAKVAFSIFQSMKRIQPLPVCAGFFICIRNSLDRPSKKLYFNSACNINKKHKLSRAFYRIQIHQH